MGDWVITYHWFRRTSHRPSPQFPEPDAWAARLGELGSSGIVQLETLQRYGYQYLSSSETIGACAPYGYLANGDLGRFSLAWNYLIAPTSTSNELFNDSAPLVEGVALNDGGRRLLCFRSALTYRKPLAVWRMAESHNDPTHEMRVIEALAGYERSLSGRLSTFIAGLWTREHGYLHTGELVLDLREPWQSTESAELQITGAYNQLNAEWRGPYAGSIYATCS